MDKHTKKTPSLFRYPVLVAFGLFFIGLFVLDMATLRFSTIQFLSHSPCFLPGCSCWTLSRRTGPTVNWKTPP